MKGFARTALEIATGIAVVSAAVIWLSGGCGPRIAPEDGPPIRTRESGGEQIVTVERVRGPSFERSSGTVASARHATVSSKILARVESIAVRAGSEVKEGDVLVRLDRRDLEARVRAARESVSGARSALEFARSERERVEELWASNVASLQQLEQARTQYDVARSAFERAQELLRDAEVAMSHAEIRSPVAGRVVDRLAEPGDTAAPGAPLLRIYDPGALRLDVPVRESLATRLSPGQEIRVRIEAIDRNFEGMIDEIVPYAEPGARTFLVKIRLPQDPRLFAGMFGRADIPAGDRQRLRVPTVSVQRIGQLEYADVVRDDAAIERRWITTGPVADPGWVEVLSGLAPGERVVLRDSSGNSGDSRPASRTEVGAELQAAVVRRAGEALAPLKLGLRSALQSAMASGGPMSAIDVCRVRAPQIAADFSSQAIRVGRTSHRVRNPENAPKPWMEALLFELRKKSVAAGAYRIVSVDDEWIGYAEPIYLEPLCTVCHGTSIEESLSQRLNELYPFDQAVGFSPGDFRGLFWVEISRRGIANELHPE